MADMPTWEEAKAASKPAGASENTPAREESAPVVAEAKAETPETQPAKAEEPKIDYAAELEKYKNRLADAEKVAEKRLKALERISKSKSSNDGEAEEATQEQKPDDLEKIIEQKTTERLERFQREQASDVIDDILSGLSDDENEKVLVKTLYENGEVKPTGYTRKAIEADLKKAFLLANAPRLESIAMEKAKAQVRKAAAEEKALLNASSSAGSAGREPPQTSANPPLNDKEQAWMDYLADKLKR